MGPASHYLSIEISQKDDTIIVMQTIYINQLLNSHWISNCNPFSTPIVESTSLAPTFDNYLLDIKDISAYKQFTRSVQ